MESISINSRHEDAAPQGNVSGGRMRHKPPDLPTRIQAWAEAMAQGGCDQRAAVAESFLGAMGWSEPVPLACPGEAARFQPAAYLLTRNGMGAAVALFLAPGHLRAPGVLEEQSLDYGPAARALCHAVGAMKVRYALLTDLTYACLYDTQTGELLTWADSPETIAFEICAELEAPRVERGVLDEFRRPPRSQVARSLREWRARWVHQLTTRQGLAEEGAGRLLDRLILLRHMAERNVLRRAGWHLRPVVEDLLTRAAEGNTAGLGSALLRLFEGIERQWRARIFAGSPEERAPLEDEPLARSLLQEWALQSRTKFHPETILESFNYGGAQEKARVRMVPDPDEERMSMLRRQPPEKADEIQIRVDIDAEGYRAIGFWLDQVVGSYARLSREFEAPPPTAEAQPQSQDLIAWSEDVATTPRAFLDPYQQAIEKGLVLTYRTPHQLRVGRIVLYLHLMESYRAAKIRLVRFPDVDAAFRPDGRVVDRTEQGAARALP